MKTYSLPTEFSFSAFLSAGWQLLQEKFGAMLKLAGMSIVFVGIPEAIVDNITKTNEALGGMLGFAVFFWSTFITMNLLKMLIDTLKGEEPSLNKLSANTDRYLTYLGGTILLTLRVVLGILLFVIPGIMWAIQFQFVPFLIVDKKLGIKEAFAMSSKMTDGKKMELFLFAILFGLFTLAGIFAFFIGVLITATITMLAQVVLYQYLLKEVEQK